MKLDDYLNMYPQSDPEEFYSTCSDPFVRLIPFKILSKYLTLIAENKIDSLEFSTLNSNYLSSRISSPYSQERHGCELGFVDYYSNIMKPNQQPCVVVRAKGNSANYRYFPLDENIEYKLEKYLNEIA